LRLGQNVEDIARIPPGARAKVQTALMKKLHLSPAQLGQVEEINADKM